MMRHEERFTHELGKMSSSERYLRNRLNGFAEDMKTRLRADALAILLLDEAGQTLTVWSSFGERAPYHFGVRILKNQGVFWKVMEEGRSVSLPDLEPDHGSEGYASMICAPLAPGGERLGAICAQNRERRDFTPEDVSALEKGAAEISGAVKAAWFVHVTRRKIQALEDLNELNRQLALMSGRDEIINSALKAAVELTGARLGAAFIEEPGGDVLSWSFPPEAGGEISPDLASSGAVSQAAASGEPVRVDHVEAGGSGLENVARKAALIQPMTLNGEVMGAMIAADRVTAMEGRYTSFSSEEADTLSSIARAAAQALARARSARRLEDALEENRRNVEELSLLFHLSTAMQQVISLDDTLRVILSCVTVGRGLGFNRAMLLMVNENTGLLQGMMGLGPDSPEEAGRIWSDLEEHAVKTPDLVRWLVEQDPYEIKDSLFNRFARSIRTPLDGGGALARAVREKRAVNVTGPGQLDEEDRELVEGLQCDRFAIVPLIASDDVMGAILVDNRYNGQPIADSGLELLTRFAAPAAWSIENIKLVERLTAVNKELIALESQMARVEKLSALGEISAEVAHELKNPLVTIGGFARRLLAKLPGSKTEAKYASIIVKEVERLETLLKNTLDVTKESVVNRKAVDLNQVVAEAADFYWRGMTEKGIKLNMALSPDIGKVYIDAAQIKQVVINLLLNALEAMTCPRHGLPREMTVKTEAIPGPTKSARLSISDTGGGIAERDLPNIFNTFFTTKPSGTGLGLSLCKKIVRMHHGVMEIDNKLGIGVTFTIILPCKTQVI